MIKIRGVYLEEKKNESGVIELEVGHEYDYYLNPHSVMGIYQHPVHREYTVVKGGGTNIWTKSPAEDVLKLIEPHDMVSDAVSAMKTVLKESPCNH